MNAIKMVWCGHFVLIAFVAMTLLACGSEDEEPGEIESEDPKVQIDPIRLDFSDQIAPGSEEQGQITFTNIGGETLEINDLSINPNGPPVYFPGDSFPTSTLLLEPLESHTFSVWYRPNDDQRHRSAINFRTNDPDPQSQSVIPLASDAYNP